VNISILGNSLQTRIRVRICHPFSGPPWIGSRKVVCVLGGGPFSAILSPQLSGKNVILRTFMIRGFVRTNDLSVCPGRSSFPKLLIAALIVVTFLSTFAVSCKGSAPCFSSNPAFTHSPLSEVAFRAFLQFGWLQFASAKKRSGGLVLRRHGKMAEQRSSQRCYK